MICFRSNASHICFDGFKQGNIVEHQDAKKSY